MSPMELRRWHGLSEEYVAACAGCGLVSVRKFERDRLSVKAKGIRAKLDVYYECLRAAMSRNEKVKHGE